MSVNGTPSVETGLSVEDFEAIHEAVLETAKGRWFLGEYARRHRHADTLTLLDAMKKLERAAGANPSPAEQAELAAIAAAIRATRSDIAAVRNDMIEGGGAIADAASVYDNIAASARSTASELMSRTQTLQGAGATLKSGNAAEAPVIEAEAQGLQSLAWSQDVLSQRIAKAMGLLAHIDERVVHYAQAAAAPAASLALQLAPENLRFFKQDEEVFAAPVPVRPAEDGPVVRKPRVIIRHVQPDSAAAPAEAAPVAAALPEPVPPEAPAAPAEVAAPVLVADTEAPAEKRRIVIIRRAASDQMAIPLVQEAAAAV